MKSIVFSAFIIVLVALFGCIAAKTVVTEKVKTEPQINSTALCTVCEIFAKLAELYVKEEHLNATEIIAKLDGLCADLPSILQKECDLFVSTYLEQLVDNIVAGVPADVVCENPLKICSSSLQRISKN